MNKASILSADIAYPGVLGYPEFNQNIYFSKETLDRIVGTLVSSPVVLTHDGDSPVGYVTDCFLAENGYYRAKVAVFDENAKKALENGWGFSTQVNILKTSPEGDHFNGVLYDYEVLDGEFIHLAVVENPRHNRAKIIKNNSLEEESLNMFFNRKDKVDNEKKSSKQATVADKQFVRVNDQVLHINELVNNYKKVLENEQLFFQEGDTIEVEEGKVVPIEELIDCWLSNCGQEPEETEQVESSIPVGNSTLPLNNNYYNNSSTAEPLADTSPVKRLSHAVKSGHPGGEANNSFDFKINGARKEAIARYSKV